MTGDQLDAVFGALADPTRRAILARLTAGDATVAELAAPFPVSQPAISRHLKVLERAGLISRRRQRTARLSHLEAAPLREATSWLAGYQEFWDESFDRLDSLLAILQDERTDRSDGDPTVRRSEIRKESFVEQTMTTTRIVAEPGTHQIEITREFAAPRELVYRAFTEPDLLVQWLGPRDLTMSIDDFDVRHGGTWRFVHRDAAGNDYGFHGVFHNDPSVDGIVRTFEFEGTPGHVSLETATFEERGGRTLLREIGVYQSVADRDAMIASGMESGVTDSMDRLEELLARLAAGR